MFHLFKDGERDVANYRPISILPVVSKITQPPLHIHDNERSGFRKFHSTETALIKLIDQVLFDLDRNRVTGMVLVEYQKAFDMVDHSLLVSKLRICGLDDHAINWIKSYLQDRRQCVILNDIQLPMRNIPHGIPQG